VIAVASGKGLADLFQDAGCAAIVPGGQTLNPSASELIEAAMASGTEDVIVLPNNGNVVLTANQAAAGDVGPIRLHVVATRSMPQGTAAMLGFNSALSLEANLATMEISRAAVETLEVTQAVRDSIVDGQEVSQGQFMCILDGALVALAADAETALLAGMPESGITEDSIVTIYRGEGSDEGKCSELQSALEANYDGVQVDVFDGGQPHYPYLASVE
jgi:dihydroxyacetone kinase-like predicted kinase